MTNNEEGQGLTEYLILMLLVAVVSIGAVRSLGVTVRSRLNTVQQEISERVTIRGGGSSRSRGGGRPGASQGIFGGSLFGGSDDAGSREE